ncbi:MAG: efflux transporter periplasmic adaptor subunit [Methylophaga sp.]|nr:MAG: efflux transporter periplasmic adaptor subunit [Methylophaga sp.]
MKTHCQRNLTIKTLFWALIFLPLIISITSYAGSDDDDHSHDPSHGVIDDVKNYFKHIFEHDPHDENENAHGAENDHDKDDTTIAITDFTDFTELFVEFPALVLAHESVFIIHLTRLDNFQPISSGVVTLTLSGGGVETEVFSINKPDIPGIFRLAILPVHTVSRQLNLHFKGEEIDVIHPLGIYKVHPSQNEAEIQTIIEEAPVDAISFLKEQQWQLDFAVTPAVIAQLRQSIQATGSLRPRADGEVHLSAVSTGHLRSKGKFPYPGMQVEAGQLLADITPRLGTGVDLSTLKAAVDKARSTHNLAKQERQRLAKLWQAKAVAKSRLLKAESAEVISKTELNTAMRRYQQIIGGTQNNLTIPIIAPISGILAQVNVASGQYVDEGDALFHIVNLERLWLEARIAEADIALLQQPSGAWFTLTGFDSSFNTFDLDGSMVALGGAIDAVSRTVPLIFEFNSPDQRLRSGMFATVRVYTGKTTHGVVVPTSAIFNDGGQEVVYVMLGGETFQRRLVRLGMRDGEQVQLISGVEAGERVVSRGAYSVRLASADSAEVGHGHAH